MKAWSAEKISPLVLVLLITGAIDSIRNLPGTALFGSQLIFFFIFAAIIFLIPIALVAAELSAAWSDEEGGIYSWVKLAFGDTAAFFAIWFQWINTIVWYPTVLSFIAGTLAYIIDPALAQNKLYLITVILIVFWTLTSLGLSGIHASANFASVCAILGIFIPILLFIILTASWIISDRPLAIHLSWHTIWPHWQDTQSWLSLTTIMASFLGMELAAVHVRNIRNPQYYFPRAMMISILFILSTMILGSLAIAFVLPNQQINLVDGVMQTFKNFFQAYHLLPLMPIVVILILLGSLGGMINWIIAPAKGLLLAANQGFLPIALHKLNKHGVPSRILITQACLVTCFCIILLIVPSINEFYWLFTALSTELYVLMYVLMFLAACRLHIKYPKHKRPFKIPGGGLGFYLTCLLGLIGCILTLIIGFIPPPDSLLMGNLKHFRLLFSIGMLLMILPACILLCFKKMPKL